MPSANTTTTRWRPTRPQVWYLAFAFFTQLAAWVVTSTLPWYALQVGSGVSALAVVQSLQFLPSLLLAPIAGVWADRFRPSLLLRWTTGLTAVAVAAVAVASAGASWLAVVSVAVFSGLVTGTSIFQFSAIQVLLGSIVSDADRARLVGVSGTVSSICRILGPALSASLIMAGGAPAAFAGGLFAAVLALAALAPLKTVEVVELARPRTSFGDGLRYVHSQPALVRELLTFTVVSLVVLNFGTLVPLAVDAWYDNDPRVLGAANVALGIGALVGGVLLATAKAHVSRARRAALVGLAAAGSVLALRGQGIVAFLILLSILGCARLIYTTTVQVAVVTGTVPEHRGKVAALYAMAFNGTTSVGSLLTAAIVAWAGVAAGLIVTAVVSAGAALVRDKDAPIQRPAVVAEPGRGRLHQ